MDNNFIVELIARLNTANVATDYEKIKRELSNKEIDIKTVVDSATSKQEIQNLAVSLQKILSDAGLDIDTSKISSSIRELQRELNTVDAKKINDLASSMLTFRDNNTRMSTDMKIRLNGMYNSLINGANKSERELKELTRDFSKFKLEVRNAGMLGQSFGDKMKNAWSKFSQWGFATSALMKIWNEFKEGIQFIRELDDALTDVAYTSNVSKMKLEDLGNSSVKMAKDLKASASNVLEAVKIYSTAKATTDDILRKSKPAIILSNVSGMSGAESSKTIQTSLNQFELEDTEEGLMDIVDTLEYVSSQLNYDFAEGMKQITEGIEASGSVAKNAGLNIQEYAAMVGVAVEKTGQSGSTIGNAYKTIFSRITKASEIEGTMADDISKAEEALRGINVQVRSSNNDFRDMTDIMADIGKVWDNLNDTQKANVGYEVAGIRQLNVLNSLFGAWEDYSKIVENSENRAGMALKNQEEYAHSLEGRLKDLGATGKSIWNNVFSTDDFKNFIEFGTDILEIIDKITSVLGTWGTLSFGTVLFNIGKNLGTTVTYNEDLGKFQKKITLFGKTFDETSRAVSSRFSDFREEFKKTKNVVNSWKNTKSISNRLYGFDDSLYYKNNVGEIINESNIDSYLPELTTTDAEGKLAVLQKYKNTLKDTVPTLADYNGELGEGDQYLVEFAKSNDVATATVEQLKVANVGARQEILKNNEAMKQQEQAAKTASSSFNKYVAIAMIAIGVISTIINLVKEEDKAKREILETDYSKIHDSNIELKNEISSLEDLNKRLKDVKTSSEELLEIQEQLNKQYGIGDGNFSTEASHLEGVKQIVDDEIEKKRKDLSEAMDTEWENLFLDYNAAKGEGAGETFLIFSADADMNEIRGISRCVRPFYKDVYERYGETTADEHYWRMPQSSNKFKPTDDISSYLKDVSSLFSPGVSNSDNEEATAIANKILSETKNKDIETISDLFVALMENEDLYENFEDLFEYYKNYNDNYNSVADISRIEHFFYSFFTTGTDNVANDQYSFEGIFSDKDLETVQGVIVDQEQNFKDTATEYFESMYSQNVAGKMAHVISQMARLGYSTETIEEMVDILGSPDVQEVFANVEGDLTEENLDELEKVVKNKLKNAKTNGDKWGQDSLYNFIAWNFIDEYVNGKKENLASIEKSKENFAAKSINADKASLETLKITSDSLSLISDLENEVLENGYLSYETIEKIKEITGLTGEAWENLLKKLLGINTVSELEELTTELTYSTLYKELAMNNSKGGILDIEKNQLVELLKQRGVYNANEVAEAMLDINDADRDTNDAIADKNRRTTLAGKYGIDIDENDNKTTTNKFGDVVADWSYKYKGVEYDTLDEAIEAAQNDENNEYYVKIKFKSDLEELADTAKILEPIKELFNGLKEEGRVSLSNLKNVQDAVKNIVPDWEKYENVLFNATTTTDVFNSAIDDLVYEVVKSQIDLTEATQEEVTALLEELNVSDAEAKALEYLNRVKAEQIIQNELYIDSEDDVGTVFDSKIDALKDMAEDLDITTEAYANLLLQEIMFGNHDLSVDDKITKIKNLALALMATTGAYANLQTLIDMPTLENTKDFYNDDNDHSDVLEAWMDAHGFDVEVKKNANGDIQYVYDGKGNVVEDWLYKDRSTGLTYETSDEVLGVLFERGIGSGSEIDFGNDDNDSSGSSVANSKPDKPEFDKLEYSDMYDEILTDKQNVREQFEKDDDKLQRELENAIEVGSLEDVDRIVSLIKDNNEEAINQLQAQHAEEQRILDEQILPLIFTIAPELNVEGGWKNVTEVQKQQIRENYEKAILEENNRWKEQSYNILSANGNEQTEEYKEAERKHNGIIDFLENESDKYDKLVSSADAYIEDLEEIPSLIDEINDSTKETVKDGISAIEDVFSDYERYVEHQTDELQKQADAYDIFINKATARVNAEKSMYTSLRDIRSLQRAITAELESNKALSEYLDEDTRKLLFNDEDYEVLSTKLSDISADIADIGAWYENEINALTKDNWYLESAITAEYERRLASKEKEYEIARAELDLEKKKQELNNILNEKNIRMLTKDENGNYKWEQVYDAEQASKVVNEISKLEGQISENRLQSFEDSIINNKQREIELYNQEKSAIEKQIELINEEVEIFSKAVEDLVDPLDDFQNIIKQLNTRLGGIVYDVTNEDLVKEKRENTSDGNSDSSGGNSGNYSTNKYNFSKKISDTLDNGGSVSDRQLEIFKDAVSSRNYAEEIEWAVLQNRYDLAKELEKERNNKIDALGLDYEKTYNYQAFDNGGSAFGKGFMFKDTDYEEIVLNPEQTDYFKKFSENTKGFDILASQINNYTKMEQLPFKETTKTVNYILNGDVVLSEVRQAQDFMVEFKKCMQQNAFRKV